MAPRCPWAAGARVGIPLLSRGLQRARVWGLGGAPLAQRAARFWGWGARAAQGERAAGRRLGARGLQEPFPLDGYVSRDVLLFEYERPRFFRYVGLFCVSQLLFWLFLADFAFTSLREPADASSSSSSSSSPEEPGSAPQRRPAPRPWLGNLFNLTSFNFSTDKWRYGFSASCLAAGTLILMAGSVYARRSVSRVLLLRGSQEVTFTTYYLFGFTSSFTVPLRHISCMSHRSEVAAVIPVKIKGKPFYFLLDKQGSIASNPLFDITVGAYREW